ISTSMLTLISKIYPISLQPAFQYLFGCPILLPLLTTLFITEFGFLVTAAGAYFSGKSSLESDRRWSQILLTAVCGTLAVAFFILGLTLWQETAGQVAS
ncbi:MAG: hypothetical protein AB2689_23885, partial [Candidatus Thiodiazotropha taylori]